MLSPDGRMIHPLPGCWKHQIEAVVLEHVQGRDTDLEVRKTCGTREGIDRYTRRGLDRKTG